MTALNVQKQKDGALPTSMTPSIARNPFQFMRSLLHWDPFQEMGPMVSAGEPSFLPDFEVRENKDSFLFKADVPGIKEADLQITVNDNQLVICGKRDAEERRQDENYYLYERSYGSFSRTFTLPNTADCEKSCADLKEGVLTISIPKKPEAQPKKINFGTTTAKA